MVARLVAINVCGAAGLIVAGLAGWLDDAIFSDATYMSHAMAAIACLGLALTWSGRMAASRRTGTMLVILGLVGTLLGFKIALGGVGDQSDLRATLTVLLSGMATAINTTLVGAVGSLWLALNRWMMQED